MTQSIATRAVGSWITTRSWRNINPARRRRLGGSSSDHNGIATGGPNTSNAPRCQPLLPRVMLFKRPIPHCTFHVPRSALVQARGSGSGSLQSCRDALFCLPWQSSSPPLVVCLSIVPVGCARPACPSAQHLLTPCQLSCTMPRRLQPSWLSHVLHGRGRGRGDVHLDRGVEAGLRRPPPIGDALGEFARRDGGNGLLLAERHF
mmetsp:Transcript_11239/g.28746  ORF Transcript_11239/g.28746 Transcript_11239/m.28746 type:complete len:204 (-) Transcript_11239:105-716(-)